MVAAPFIPLEELDPDKIVMSKEEIQELLPQRNEFAQLDAICHMDPEAGIIVAYKDLALDEWWAKGHIPGHPLMPGVMMIEAAAQNGAIMLNKFYDEMKGKFIGFGGVDKARFRGSVEPGSRIYYMAKRDRFRAQMATMPAQAWVDNRLVFEGKILGVVLEGVS